MPSRRSFLSSTVGSKLLVAVTGLSLVGFLVMHLIGNLLLYLGPETFNHYSHKLISNPLVYPAEAGLVLLFLLHAWKTIELTLASPKARPSGYEVKKPAPAHQPQDARLVDDDLSAACSCCVFVPIHIKTFKFGTYYASAEPGVRDLNRLVLEIFSHPGYVVFYVVGMIVVGFHLWHGASSTLQTLGADTPRVTPGHPPRGPGARARPRRRIHLDTALDLHHRGPVMTLDSKIPSGPLAEKWDRHKFEIKLVNPANKRKYTIIVVGSGLAGASAAASLGELGYNVLCFCIHDSPRRAHSIAAQGGINAAKNYQNDGDSIYRLFYDTIKGGDYRAREANVYRLAQNSVTIIDQCVAQGVPFAREYGGMLDNRSFGGAQVSRTFYARGQTGQQLLLGAYQALMRQVAAGTVTMFTAPRDARPRRRRRQGARHRHAQPDHRRDRAPRRRTPCASRPAATATSTTSRPTRCSRT